MCQWWVVVGLALLPWACGVAPLGMRAPTARESVDAQWGRPPAAYASSVLVWLRPDASGSPAQLEDALRTRGILVRFARRVFGQHVLMLSVDAGAPKSPADVDALRALVEAVRAHPWVRECRADFADPAAAAWAPTPDPREAASVMAPHDWSSNTE